MIDLSEYGKRAYALAIYPRANAYVYPALKLAGEAGEVAEKVGKSLRGDYSLDDPNVKLELLKELGDVLWYVNALANDLGADLQTVADMNITKLESRKARGVLAGSGDNR
ncbi:MAG: hypothetical protein E6R03_08570 [Hyphomicrobiaceae bacterium]|nr:MAG: hypothetical protein E6R03_08570 [Hyphomicrobiaceae bacterium]